MKKKIFLSVVIPAYNEEKSIKGGSLEKVWEYMRKQPYSWEVLVADDGSTDRTAELAEKYTKTHKGFVVLREPHRGKGGIVIAGSLAAKGEIILFMDMDQATPIKHIEDFLPKFKAGADVVIGRRSGRKGAPLVRKMMAFGFVVIRSIFLRLPFPDTQCGFKAFRRKAARSVFSQMNSFLEKKNVKGAAVQAGFDLELLFLARKRGYKIADVVVEWNYGERRQVNPVKDSLEALKDIFRIRLNMLLGRYDL